MGFATVLLVPTVASAGMLSFVANLFSSPDRTETVVTANSQNIDLLTAPVSPNPDAASGGADVFIVDGEALSSESSPASTEDQDTSKQKNGGGQISIYVVRSGDSISEIADMFGVSVNTILWTNGLKSKTLKEGQVLVILPITGVKHTVAKGDTVESIAKKYEGDVDEIRDYNDIEPGAALALGSEVIIPDGVIAAPAAPKSNTRAGIPSVASSAGSAPAASGYYIRPVSGGVRTQGIHGYNGIDIGIGVGATVYASAGGNVIISKDSGWNGGYGGYVVIAHDNGTQTLYAHLSGAIVSQGQRVVQGQVIGYTGNSGKSTGPHLHFEVRGARNPF